MASNIRSLRERLEMTQAQIASHLGVTANTFARWERDGSPPKWLLPHLRMLVDEMGRGSPLYGSRTTILDPFHRKILELLNQKVDPFDFEACAVELIQKSGTDVVLIGGRGDEGFDGSVTNSDGDASPLIITTSTDVLRNFKTNLSKAKSHTDSRVVYLATTKTILQSTRKQLKEFAATNGFRIGQIFDQNWFATHLYRDPPWCKKLLGVTGRISALCSIPETSRPIVGDTVIGRDQELRTLQESNEDCLLIGPPGSGKTFLFLNLVREHCALFLCDDDREAIADAVREYEPRIVLVDDAHSYIDRLKAAVSIRNQMGVDFRIFASSWPISQFVQSIEAVLGTSEVNFVELGPLDDRQILEVIEKAGVTGPIFLQAMLRQQASGMPGLAITLSHLILSSKVNIKSVASGETLMNQLVPQLSNNIDSSVRPILSAFAVGGNSGMSSSDVATVLNKDKGDLLHCLTELNEAGIVSPKTEDHIVVQPFELAVALVRNAYFADVPNHSVYLELFHKSPWKPQSLKVLIHAHAYGGRFRDIERLVTQHATNETLVDYASIGENEGRFVIKHFPDRLLDTARGFLRASPEYFLPIVFDHVIHDYDNFRGGLSKMKETIESWLSELPPDHPDFTVRRFQLIEATLDWVERQTTLGLHSALLGNTVLTKAFEGHWSGTTASAVDLEFIYYDITPNLDHTRRLQVLWTKAGKLVGVTANISESWTDSLDLIRQWCYAFGKNPIDDVTTNARKQFATAIRNDLAEYIRDQPGLLTVVSDYDKDLLDCNSVQIDSLFKILFPRSTPKIGNFENESIKSKLIPVRDKLVQKGPKCAALTLARIEREASKANIRYPRLTPQLCNMVANVVDRPLDWIQTVLQEKCPGDLAMPFLTRGAQDCKQDTIDLITKFNTDHTYDQQLLQISVDDVNAFLKNEAHLSKYITAHPDALDVALINSNIDPKVLSKLLTSDLQSVRYISALSYYRFKNRSPKENSAEWQDAILDGDPSSKPASSNEFHLEKIFEDDQELAVAWLKRHFTPRKNFQNFRMDSLVTKVIRLLSKKKRMALIGEIDVQNVPSDAAIELVGSSVDCYSKWLSVQSNVEMQLAPLTNPEIDTWSELAVVALEHGVQPLDIADHVAITHDYAWIGSEIDMWKERRESYERFRLQNDTNRKLARTVEHILKKLDNWIDEVGKRTEW